MTNIILYKKNRQIIGFEIKGHTGKAERGSDILCSAISSTSQMIVVGINEILNLNAFVEISDGYLKIKLRECDYENEKAQVLFKTFEKSIREIIVDEKKYVRMEVRNEI
ncbi:MAG: ribosomal-processing cysteine protease Prp [Clostridia bacterium]|nr:ribosomal-processing cysteine protease Prp [Clostridia bacterium]